MPLGVVFALSTRLCLLPLLDVILVLSRACVTGVAHSSRSLCVCDRRGRGEGETATEGWGGLEATLGVRGARLRVLASWGWRLSGIVFVLNGGVMILGRVCGGIRGGAFWFLSLRWSGGRAVMAEGGVIRSVDGGKNVGGFVCCRLELRVVVVLVVVVVVVFENVDFVDFSCVVLFVDDG